VKSNRPSLAQVSTSVLESLLSAVQEGAIAPPLTRAGLAAIGLRNQEELLEPAFRNLDAGACRAVILAILNERVQKPVTPELVWTGPEYSTSTARDTSVVLTSLFESARNDVVLAGYCFDHPTEVLGSLHATMKTYGVLLRMFIDIPQLEGSTASAHSHIATHCGEFLAKNWPFGTPLPRVFYDKRAAIPGPPFVSMHAKCVVIDGQRAFVSSANFTERGQERNIEVGVLIDDSRFAYHLAAQFDGLVKSGLVGEYTGN